MMAISNKTVGQRAVVSILTGTMEVSALSLSGLKAPPFLRVYGLGTVRFRSPYFRGS
jgi:hypothetical protein